MSDAGHIALTALLVGVLLGVGIRCWTWHLQSEAEDRQDEHPDPWA